MVSAELTEGGLPTRTAGLQHSLSEITGHNSKWAVKHNQWLYRTTTIQSNLVNSYIECCTLMLYVAMTMKDEVQGRAVQKPMSEPDPGELSRFYVCWARIIVPKVLFYHYHKVVGCLWGFPCINLIFRKIRFLILLKLIKKIANPILFIPAIF